MPIPGRTKRGGRGFAVVVLALSLAGACASTQTRAAEPGAAEDIRTLAREIGRVHPRPFHTIAADAFRREVDALAERAPSLDRDQLLVGVMRLVALLGERDGHSGLFPLDEHDRRLNLYPLRLYAFADGTYVVGSAGVRGVVGARLVAIEGQALADVEAKVAPLVPRDNEHSLRARVAQYVLTAEVLHGLGITATAGRATFTLEQGGTRREVALAPMPAERYSESFADLWHPMVPQSLPQRAAPLSLRHRNDGQWLGTTNAGRTLYLGYSVTLGNTAPLARQLVRRARSAKIRRVVVDLRHNPGGDVATYAPILGALRSRTVNRPGRLVVLVGRGTFSAATLLAEDLERTTRAVFVGEPTGGSPNLYGDPTPIDLPSLGWRVNIATRWWRNGPADDPRLALDPRVRVPLSSSSFFGNRDPVLAAAVALR